MRQARFFLCSFSSLLCSACYNVTFCGLNRFFQNTFGLEPALKSAARSSCFLGHSDLQNNQSNKKGAETGALILNLSLGCRKGPIEPMGERFDVTRLDRCPAPDAQA